MTRARDDERLSPEDEALVARLREDFAPESLDAARSSAFDARLRERLERTTSRPWAWAALASAAAAALAWAVLPAALPSDEPERASGSALLVAQDEPDGAQDFAWEENVLFGEELDDLFAVGDDDLLPPDYLVLASALD